MGGIGAEQKPACPHREDLARQPAGLGKGAGHGVGKGGMVRLEGGAVAGGVLQDGVWPDKAAKTSPVMKVEKPVTVPSSTLTHSNGFRACRRRGGRSGSRFPTPSAGFPPAHHVAALGKPLGKAGQDAGVAGGLSPTRTARVARSASPVGTSA